MNPFAIGVVLLPPDPVMDMALQLNRELCNDGPGNIILDKTHYIPHITLAMGCLPAEHLDRAKALLQSITTQHSALELRVPQLKAIDRVAGDKVITLDVALSPGLARLHESVVSAFRPLLNGDVTDEALHGGPPIEKSSIDWINHFIPNYCYQHFWPHITIGFGALPDNFEPFSFLASRLVICHLGNHCTCRRILGETTLGTL